MAGGGFILGGLLQGVGKGQEMSYLEARDTARAELKRQQTNADTIATEDRAEKRAIANDQRDTKNKAGLLGLASQYKIAEGETEQAYRERLERIKAQEDRKTAGFKSGLDIRLATVKAGLDRANDSASKQQAADIDNGKIKEVRTDANGREVLVYNDGRMVATVYTAPDKGTLADTVDALGKPIPKPKRGPTPASFDPSAPAAPSNSGSSGAWYNGGAPSASDQPKVATLAQLKETAKATGQSMEQVRAWAKANGWKLTQ